MRSFKGFEATYAENAVFAGRFEYFEKSAQSGRLERIRREVAPFQEKYIMSREFAERDSPAVDNTMKDGEFNEADKQLRRNSEGLPGYDYEGAVVQDLPHQ